MKRVTGKSADIDLIGQLFLEAARVMEDTSVELVRMKPARSSELKRRLNLLRRAGEDITAFSAAAHAAYRRRARS